MESRPTLYDGKFRAPESAGPFEPYSRKRCVRDQTDDSPIAGYFLLACPSSVRVARDVRPACDWQGVSLGAGHSEKRIFECARCGVTEIGPLRVRWNWGIEPFNGYDQAADMSLTVIRIAMRIGISCALIVVGAAGLLVVVRYMAWAG